jgi:hypothetical protein
MECFDDEAKLPLRLDELVMEWYYLPGDGSLGLMPPTEVLTDTTVTMAWKETDPDNLCSRRTRSYFISQVHMHPGSVLVFRKIEYIFDAHYETNKGVFDVCVPALRRTVFFTITPQGGGTVHGQFL